jgi:hypothetical protein
MEEVMLTGYQWGTGGVYIGVYEFPANKDQYEIHLPPNTTMTAPPTGLPVDMEAAWDGTQWVVRRVQFDWMPDVSQFSENFFGLREPLPEEPSDAP